MTPMERRKGRYMRAPDGHGEGGGEGGGGGGVADLLGGDGGAGAGQGGEGGGGGQGEGGPWYAGLSDQAVGEGQLSDRAWLENKKYADLPTLVKTTRELEGRFLAGDKIVMPKDGDAPEVFDSFYKAIGRPESADAYEIPVPEGQELDEGFAGKIKDAAFKAGVPAGMMKPLAEAFNAHIVELQQNAEAQAAEAKRAGVAEVKTEWGDKFTANIANANKAMRMLDLDAEKIGKMESGMGTADTLRLLSRLGAGMGEDVLLGGGAAKVFSVSPAEARTELENMAKDADLRAKVIAKDPTITARRAMLIQVVAAEEERKRST
jgi:hypothetical protein